MVAGTTLRLALMGEPTVGSEEGELLWVAAWGSEAHGETFRIPKDMSKQGSLQDWGPWEREEGQPSLIGIRTVGLQGLGREGHGALPRVGILGELPIASRETCLGPPFG